MSTEITRRKLIIVGDGACGKTSLLYVFTLGEFPTEYHPTIFENYVTDCRIDGKPIQLALWDTAGQEEYERLRPLSYNNSNIILIAFALDTPISLDNTRTKWVEEVKKYCPNTPYLLCGLKKDLRQNASNANINSDLSKNIINLQNHINNTNNELNKDHFNYGRRQTGYVSYEQGEAMAKQIHAKAYMESSALTGEGVDDIFEYAVRVSLMQSQKSNDGCCTIL